MKTLPQGWREVALDKLATRGSGHTPDRQMKSYWDGGIKWVSLADTNKLDRVTISETSFEISEDGIENSSAVKHPAGSVIVSRDAGVGKSAITTSEMAVSQHFIAWQCGRDLHNYFLYYWLQKKKPLFERMAVGSTIKTIGLPFFAKLTIQAPLLPEQKRIAHCLLTWDHGILKLEALLAAKRDLKRGLMQRLLTGRTRFKEFKGEKWRRVCVSDIIEQVTRRNSSGCHRVLTGSGEHGLIDQREYYSRRVASEDVSSYYLVKRGEFAYNRSSSNGYPFGAIKRLDAYDEGVLSTLYLVFRIKNSVVVDSNFLDHIFEGGYFIAQLGRLCREGARSHGLLNITADEFFSMNMQLPSINEQKRIAAVLNVCDREIELLQKQLAALKEQKRGLMQKLLTGEIRVKV